LGLGPTKSWGFIDTHPEFPTISLISYIRLLDFVGPNPEIQKNKKTISTHEPTVGPFSS